MEKFKKMRKKIAFIGTGLIGFPMAERLLQKRYELNVFNRTKSKALPLKKLGAVIFDSSCDAITNADVVITVLTTFDANKETLFTNEISYREKTVIQMGTIEIDENIRLERKINELGGEYIEAPVLGSIPQIKSGNLLTLVGCRKELFDQFKYIFQVFGPDVHFFGKVGKASAAKLAYNQLIATLTAAFSMSLGFVIKNDVNVESFMEILRKSALYSPTFDKKLQKMLNNDFTNPNFPLKHLLKDVQIIEKDFDKCEIDTKILKAIEQILENGINKGLGDLDYSSLFNSIVGRN